jgi:hypothetical protein
MAVNDDNYNNSNNSVHHMRNDVRDAHTNSSLAKMLATLALIGAVIALAVSIAAWNKANDAAGNASRALQATNTSPAQ